MKLYSLIIAFVVMLTLNACGEGSTTTNETNDTEVECCPDKPSTIESDSTL